jgi:ATP-dependent Clp protease ATP-binding subunit ClpC
VTASYRVYFVRHHGERLTGLMMRQRENLFDTPPPAAFGATEDEIFAQLEPELLEREAKGEDVARYRWDEVFETRAINVEIHPMSAAGGRPVIGAQRIPLRITFAWAKLPAGGYRVMLPRFGWAFIVERLDIAADVIREAIAGSLAGAEARWLYEYREEGPEYVRLWAPSFLRSREPAEVERDDADYPELSRVAEEWVRQASHRRLPPVVGVDDRFAALLPHLEAEPMRSVLLLGPSGAGKTALVRRTAGFLLDRRRGKHGPRRVSRLWATSADRLVAGMKYVGMWQQRLIRIVEELSQEGDLLYCDRLGDLLRSQSDGASIADLLAPAVAAGEITLVAECDDAELERCRRKNPSFVEQLRIVRIDPPPRSQLMTLMEAYAGRVAPDLRADDAAWRRALAHLEAFRPDQSFPGKALAFIDWLGMHHPKSALTSATMSEAFARHAGLPIEIVDDRRPAPVERIAAALGSRVVGQTEACAAVARVVARLKAGMQDPERPVANLFFAGPTGVGKTQLAKELARYLFGDATRLIRVDMSEYMLPGSSQRLLEVGASSRSLAQRVRAQPLSVVLLDEIEKAHREVFDLLLGVLGEGRLTDTSGRLVDFRMTIVVMTSNLGGEQKRPVGFGGNVSGADHAKAVLQHFRPELVGRLDRIVSFRALAPEDVGRILDLEVTAIAERPGLAERGVSLRIDDEAREVLVSLGYDPAMGARPLKRVLEDRVVAPLAVRLAADPGLRQARFVVGARNGEVTLARSQ